MSAPVWVGCPEVNNFEQISSDGHKMPLTGARGVDYGHMGPPDDNQTRLKTLLSHNLFDGR